MIKRKPNKYLETLLEAQKWAVAPFIFKALSAALKTGFLKEIVDNPGFSVEEYSKRTNLSKYAGTLLVDLLLPADFLTINENKEIKATKLAEVLVYDDMTQADFFFSDDVNYVALDKTLDSIKSGTPVGLASFNPDWKTIYPYLPNLPEPARSSWFRFDHFHSDQAYVSALTILEKFSPRTLVDIGGNTGRFTKMFLEKFPDSKAFFVDLPVETEALKSRDELKDVINRIETRPIDWLTDEELIGIEEADLYWMSQFLDCFSSQEAISILKRTRTSMLKNRSKPALLAVLEPIVDEQRHKAAQLSLAAISLYFTVVANGNSKFFNGADLRSIFEKSGFEIIEEYPCQGISHTLFILKPKNVH